MLTPITSIKPFIDLGLYTVPLNGKHIVRNEHGKKKGYSFPSNWLKEYSDNKNTIVTSIGGLLTGNLGDIKVVAIDCDCNESYHLFRSLDPTYTAYFDSIGKVDKNGEEIKAGTILYLRTDDLPSSRKIKAEYDLDFFNGTGTVFLPTEANYTKSHWFIDGEGALYNNDKQKVEFKPMPFAVREVLKLVLAVNHQDTDKTPATTTHSTRTKGFLGRVLDKDYILDLMEAQEYDPNITKLLTPKAYRGELYNKQGHLHPNDVGARHDYQFQIMCRLADDNTVDPKLARAVMMYLNSLWDRPRSLKQLNTEIIEPIVSGRQKNSNGQPYWRYDENWKALVSWTNITKQGSNMVEMFYDPYRKSYFEYNTVTERIDEFSKFTDLAEHVRVSCTEDFSNKDAQKMINNVATMVDPMEDFGYVDNDDKFNLFEPTNALRIMHDPSIHEEDYKEPTEFINFMEHFIPSEQQRMYFLSFIRTKLTTFAYSPVVPYIVGIPGSGKGIIMTILELIMGPQYVAKEVSGGQFLNPFNKGILEHKYFVNLNELAESLNTSKERVQAVGLLKLYTGATSFQCHGKGTNPYASPMNATFILTANKHPLDIEDNDRRIYYISTPNTFISSPQCQASKSSTDIYNAIIGQVNDIAYYISTEIKNLNDNDYTTAPHHEGRELVIFEGKYPRDKIAWALYNKQFTLLNDYLTDAYKLYKNSTSDRLYLSDLVEVYEGISIRSGTDAEQDMKRAMKDAGFKIKYSGTASYYHVEGLAVAEKPVPEDKEEGKDIRI